MNLCCLYSFSRGSDAPALRLRKTIAILFLLSVLTGCATSPATVSLPAQATPSLPAGNHQGSPKAGSTPTSAPPDTPAPPYPAPSAPVNTPTPAAPRVWLSPALPAAFLKDLKLPAGWDQVTEQASANLWLEIPTRWTNSMNGRPEDALQSTWVFAVVVPFPTAQDAVSLEALHKAWSGDLSAAPGRKPILVAPETKAFLDYAWGDPRAWGPASPQGVKVVDPSGLLEAAWKDQPAWAIIPFEDIEPRWKVLRVDDSSPLDKQFDPTGGYPLAFPIRLTARPEALPFRPPAFSLPTNRDPLRLTTLVLTGVTALSRHIGEKMESQGLTYPGQEIHDWLVGADLTHISNEVSFYEACPKPGPLRADMRFCSNPKYIQLLEYIGADIIEQTGNHLLDWGYQPMLDSLELYRQRGWKWYGGGANLEEARQPLLIEHNGNRLAFLGCSPAGPEPVWATAYSPGSAPCNLAQLEQQVRALRAQGYLPVFTFQHHETDGYLPSPASGAPDFRRMAQAGALVVSGSQSHYAQTMTLVEDSSGQSSFVHYGLGNLFFDQMEPPEIRAQFIDRHIFYNGKYLGVELLTALLEDSARPRPMTPAEREKILTTIFALSVWNGQ